MHPVPAARLGTSIPHRARCGPRRGLTMWPARRERGPRGPRHRSAEVWRGSIPLALKSLAGVRMAPHPGLPAPAPRTRPTREPSLLEITMLRVSVRPIAVMGGLAIFALSLVGVPVARASSVDVTVDGGQTFQTISGLGADINPHSWDGGNLKPALDLLIDQEGMKTFRVGMDMLDWESTNDDADPRTFNWDYYNPIYSGQTSFDTEYAGSNFADTWAVIDYLHHKGIPDSGIELSFMGPGPSWMGGSSLASGQDAEFVEEVLSAAYYGYSHGHTFGLFSPNNEMDISYNEGVTMSDTRYADILNRLAGRMDALGMSGVKLLGPETCCNVGYADPMTS